MKFNNEIEGLQFCFDKLTEIEKSFLPDFEKINQLEDIKRIAQENHLNLAIQKSEKLLEKLKT